MGNYTIFLKFENPRRGRQARNFSENDPKFLDLKSSSEQIILRKLSLGAPGLTVTVKPVFLPQKTLSHILTESLNRAQANSIRT